MLYRRQRGPPTATASASSTSAPGEHLRGESDDEVDDHTDLALPSTQHLALPAEPLARRRTRRYRSRNCENFRRYGDLFHFLDSFASSSSAATTDPSAHTGGLCVPRRRSVRAHNRMLTKELRDMQLRVAELERQRDLMHSAMLNAHANAVAHAMAMVKQFYVLFANGYDPTLYPQHSRTTEAFLRAVMAEDVVCTEFRGVDLFLQQYQVTSEAHASFQIALKRLTLLTPSNDALGHDSATASDAETLQIKAEAVCTLQINRTTLERLFPPLINDEVLTQQLIGRSYCLQYDKVFHFQHGRVFQHESRVDFCTSMLALVQDPFVAMKLLDASLMTRHGHLKLDQRIEEGAYTLANAVL